MTTGSGFRPKGRAARAGEDEAATQTDRHTDRHTDRLSLSHTLGSSSCRAPVPRWEQVGSLIPAHGAPAPLRGRARDLRGQLGAQGTRRTPGASSSARPTAAATGVPGARGWPGDARPAGRARARPSPALRPSPRAARGARRRRAPASLGISLPAGPGDPGNFPGAVASCPRPVGDGGPGASAAWTHFFGCFSLFGLRFRA